MSTHIVRKLIAARFTKADAPGTYDVTLSTGDADREQDRIPPEGWIVPRRVPLLWAHDMKALPLGRVREIRVSGNALRGRMEFPPDGIQPFADTVRRLIDTGFLASVSVGFRPIDKPRANELGGVDFLGKKELLELSIVSIPANAGAAIDGRANEAAMRKWLHDDNEVLELIDDEPLVRDERIEVDPRDLAAAMIEVIPAAIADTFGDMVRREVGRALAPTRGRIAGDPVGDPTARGHRWVGEPVFDLDRARLRQLIYEIVPMLVTPEALAPLVTAALDRARGRVD